MFIDRQGFDGKTADSVAKLKDACLGCTNCKGACLDLLDLTQVPDLVLDRQRVLS